MTQRAGSPIQRLTRPPDERAESPRGIWRERKRLQERGNRGELRGCAPRLVDDDRAAARDAGIRGPAAPPRPPRRTARACGVGSRSNYASERDGCGESGEKSPARGALVPRALVPTRPGTLMACRGSSSRTLRTASDLQGIPELICAPGGGLFPQATIAVRALSRSNSGRMAQNWCDQFAGVPCDGVRIL